jgi:hypothetical protein
LLAEAREAAWRIISINVTDAGTPVSSLLSGWMVRSSGINQLLMGLANRVIMESDSKSTFVTRRVALRKNDK